MYNKRLECRLPGGPLLALATLVLLLVAVAPVSAEILASGSILGDDSSRATDYDVSAEPLIQPMEWPGFIFDPKSGRYPVEFWIFEAELDNGAYAAHAPQEVVGSGQYVVAGSNPATRVCDVTWTVYSCGESEAGRSSVGLRAEFTGWNREYLSSLGSAAAPITLVYQDSSLRDALDRYMLPYFSDHQTSYAHWYVNPIGAYREPLFSPYDDAGLTLAPYTDRGSIHDDRATYGSLYREICVTPYRNDYTVSNNQAGALSLSVIREFSGESWPSTIDVFVSGDLYSSRWSARDTTALIPYTSGVELVHRSQVTGNTTIYSSDLAADDDDFLSLSLSPTTAAVYEPITATLSPAADAPEYDEIAWIHRDEQRTFSRLADGTWKEFNYDSLEYDIPSDEHAAHNYQFTAYCPPGVVDPEDLVICCLYSEGKQIAELTGRVEIVAGSSKTQLAVVVVDHSGGQTPVLFGADVTVRDEITKQYQAETGSDETFHRFVVDKNRRYIVTASMEGYLAASRTITASKDVQSTEIYLSRNATVWVPENSTQVDFLVKDTKNRHVDGVLIALTDAETKRTLTGVTNSFGTRTFVVERGHIYQYSVTKDGYVGVRGTVDPGIPGTRTVVLCSEDAWGDTPPGQPGDPGHGPDPDHHELARETLNEVSGLIPHLFSLVFLMLFLCIMRRGGR
jgi:hypothetical protein